MKNVDKCSFCGTGVFARLFPVPIGDHSSAVVRCQNCFLAFLDPQPEPDEIKAVYQDAYFVDHVKPEILKSREDAAGGIRHRLARHLPETGRMLDIGASTGAYLAHFRSQGWEVHGVELSEFAREAALKIYGITMVADLDAAKYPDDHFDFVLLNQVIEHLPQCGGMLDTIRRILKPGGILFCTTPNFGSPAAKRQKGEWFALKPREHVVFFTPFTLARFLVRARFQIIRIDTMQAAVTTPHFEKIIGTRRAGFVSKTANRFFPGLKRAVRDLLGKLYPGDNIEVVATKPRP